MTIEQALFRLHEGLPRHAPGSEATTLKALRRLGRLPRRLRVIDLGCGNGASTLVLARRLKKPIVAVDAHQPYLDELETTARTEGIAENVETVHADFSTLGDSLGKFDLLWAEGAAYVLGFERALLTWRAMLAGGARVAVSELSYLTESPSDVVKQYWSEVYPSISTIVGNCAAAERTGYTVIDTLAFSSKATKAYFGPIKTRIAELRASGETSPELAAVIGEMEHEIELYERHSEEVGYVFYLLEVPGSPNDGEAEMEGDDSDFGETEEVCDSQDEDATFEDPEVARSARIPRRSFDTTIAPTNAAIHERHEDDLIDAIAKLGILTADRVLEETEQKIATFVVKGR
ncbi:MAG: class I SAM-dependent methyltransferase [Polyangiaceae bacterium]